MALTFEQYQKQALETNLGTIINETEPLLYPVMGMVDELSEVLEKYFINDSTHKEVGDAMWYYFVAMDTLSLDWQAAITLVSEEDVPLELDFSNIEGTLPPHPFQWTKTNITGTEIFSLARSAMHAGKALGIVKKIHRDGGGSADDGITKPKIGVLLTKSFLWLCRFAVISDIDLEQAALDNLDKLKSRKERGKLQGSGDNR